MSPKSNPSPGGRAAGSKVSETDEPVLFSMLTEHHNMGPPRLGGAWPSLGGGMASRAGTQPDRAPVEETGCACRVALGCVPAADWVARGALAPLPDAPPVPPPELPPAAVGLTLHGGPHMPSCLLWAADLAALISLAVTTGCGLS